MSDVRSEAGSLFQSRGPATSNDLSPRRVLDHCMTHVMAPDERRRRLASGADLHASERYDGAQPCSDLNISVASLKSTRRRTGSQCNCTRFQTIASYLCVCFLNTHSIRLRMLMLFVLCCNLCHFMSFKFFVVVYFIAAAQKFDSYIL